MKAKEGKILIVDDDPDVLLSGRLLLKRHFELVKTERNPKRIAEHLKTEDFDLVLLDMNFSAGSTQGDEGVHWLKKIIQTDPNIPVIMITAYGHVDMAVRAIKEGATDFVAKPWQNEKLLATVKATWQLSQSKKTVHELKSRERTLRAEVSHQSGELIVGESTAMKQLYASLEKVAVTDANVLLLGENGTGKELAAREIHRKSQRHNEVFIKVDLGAITETLFESELFGHKKGAFTDAHEDRAGRFEVASGGTLFLDEIGNLSHPLQAKLLTALQNRTVTRVGTHKAIPVDIRLISATNMPLAEMVADKSFRQDLLYRINTVEIHLPPLRERIDDIPLLTEHFLKIYSHKYHKQNLSIPSVTMKKLMSYHWPGNIRELRHAVERAVIMCEEKRLSPQDFLFQTKEIDTFAEPETLNLDEMEKILIQKAISKNQGNISKAAKDLGITRGALYRRMEKYEL